jgi:hypothetical protein
VIKAVIIRNKIQKREPGSEPRPGDMVPYVYIRVNHAKAKVHEHVEDPEFAEQQGLVLDLKHYISLLQVQVKPYFTCFPVLKIDKLFSIATDISQRYASPFLQFATSAKEESLNMKQVEMVLKTYLQNNFTQDECQTLLQLWKQRVSSKWNAMPSKFLPSMTLAQLWTALEDHMSSKPSVAVPTLLTWAQVMPKATSMDVSPAVGNNTSNKRARSDEVPTTESKSKQARIK